MQAHPLSNTAAQLRPPLSTAVGSFAGIAESVGLAHDAGNLLGALSLYSDLLRAPGVLRPEHQHYATELRTLSERSSVLLHRMFSCANRHNDPDRDERRAAVPVCSDSELSLRSLEPLLRRLAEPFAALTFNVENLPPSLPFPVEVLERILLNLVSNSAEALRRCSPSSGRIHIDLAACAGLLQLTVSDNGPGMNPLLAARFLRPEPASDDLAPGLGHRILHELVQGTGATLELRVRPGRGCTFVFTWELSGAHSLMTEDGVRAC
jgi:signal transduction histidine kinase